MTKITKMYVLINLIITSTTDISLHVLQRNYITKRYSIQISNESLKLIDKVREYKTFTINSYFTEFRKKQNSYLLINLSAVLCVYILHRVLYIIYYSPILFSVHKTRNNIQYMLSFPKKMRLTSQSAAINHDYKLPNYPKFPPKPRALITETSKPLFPKMIRH